MTDTQTSTTQEAPALTMLGERGTGPLAQRIARIAGSVGRLKEDGRVTGNRGFTYATVDAMAHALGPLMAAEGVAMYPARVEVLRDEPVDREKKGDDGPYTQIKWICELMVTWRITCGPGEGDSIDVPALGFSSDTDNSEKQANQAHTFSRINAYKAVFHLAAGDDPEQKGSKGQGAQQQHTGELPNVTDATVSGMVVMSDDGSQVGLRYEASPRTAQQEINLFTTRVLGGRWDGNGKLYAIPPEHNAAAVALARHIGLEVTDRVAAQFPAEPAPPEPPATPTAETG